MLERFIRGLIHRVNLSPAALRHELRLQAVFGPHLVYAGRRRRPRRPAGAECLGWPAYRYGEDCAIERQRVEGWS